MKKGKKLSPQAPPRDEDLFQPDDCKHLPTFKHYSGEV